MVTLMRTAMRIAYGTQYTDRQTNIQTDQQPTHPGRNPHLGRRVRAYKIFDMGLGNRKRYALCSKETQWISA